MSYDNRIQRVRAILLKDWDPLIVGDNPNLSDEYDDIISGVVELPKRRCTLEQLERHLKNIEKRWRSKPAKPTPFVAKTILEIM